MRPNENEKFSFWIIRRTMENFAEDSEFKKCFLDEALELLRSTEQCFLSLEKQPNNNENLNTIFRLAHNLKGSSCAVGFQDLAEFTHKLESLLVELKEDRIQVSGSVVDLLLRSNDYLLDVIEKLQVNYEVEYKNPELLEELIEIIKNDDEAKSQIRESNSSSSVVGLTVDAAPAQSGNIDVKEDNIRVSLTRINDLINNAGELVIYQSVLQQQFLTPGISIPPMMRATLAAMKKIIQNSRDLSMGLRMLPIKQTFKKMQRIVRDTSKALEKEVELHLSGEETEVDKTVLEKIGDPLVHLIRNAVDHGLESNETRIAAGKSKKGNVYLSAFHRAGHIVIEIRDDGKGLDAEKLIQIAKSKGIIPAGLQLSKEQAYQLIFAPGFSTKAEVTDISGRGVGMDVVKTNISNLQGQIEIETELEKGSCFRILLPLTLAIVDGIVIRLDKEKYIIPLSQVNEFFKPKPSDLNYICERTEILTIRDETLPTFRLEQLLKTKSSSKRNAADLTALVTRDSSIGSFAIFVDEVIAQQQIVIKPLGEELKGRCGLMGSAILGDGKPALILDLLEMIKNIKEKNKINTNEKMGAA